MGLFSSSLNKKRLELVCDIGNGSVGAVLVMFESGEKSPNIIFSERIFFKSKKDKSYENTITNLEKNLNNLLINVLKFCISEHVNPSKISCFHSSPWFISQTHILRIKQVEPFVFSEAILSKILKEAESNFLSNKDFKTDKSVLKDLKLIERKITRIKLNGYQTHKPLDKKTSSVEVSVFLSALRNESISIIEGAFNRVWHNIKIQHHTFPLAAFSMIRNELNTSGNFLLAHIADDITDLSIVYDEMLLDTFSFPLGKKNLIENLEEKCNLDYGLASSALSMYAKAEIHDEQIPRFASAIQNSIEDWATHFENGCNILTKNNVMPEVVYLIVDEKLFPIFESAIKIFNTKRYTILGNDLKVYSIFRDLFEKYITYSNLAQKDFFLETEVLYINLISPKEEKISDNYILE
jgi:ribosomal protein S17E